MKKNLIALLVFLCSMFSLTAQDMTKQQTLDYILRIYQRVNQFHPTADYVITVPVGIESAKLEFDQLIFDYQVSNNYIYSGLRSTTISGNLELDEQYNGIKNADGDWVLRVQPQNTAELKRLFYALQHLQSFIEKDPFSGQVNQYDQRKKQEEAESQRQMQERQRLNEQESQRMAEQRAEQRRREEDRRRQAEERERREEERRGREALKAAEDAFRRASGGG